MQVDKLFLSFAGVLHALTTRKVDIEDLGTAIICTSKVEINAAGHVDDPAHNAAFIAMGKARDEGRLIFQNDDDHNNRTTFGEINERLAAFDAPPLTGHYDRQLFEIPMRACVPSVEGGKVEVFWAECPTPEKNWRSSWQVPAACA